MELEQEQLIEQRKIKAQQKEERRKKFEENQREQLKKQKMNGSQNQAQNGGDQTYSADRSGLYISKILYLNLLINS